MHPKMFEGYDKELVEEQDLISIIRHDANTVKSYEIVYSDLHGKLFDENQNNTLEDLRNVKLSIYDELHDNINKYIEMYLLPYLFEKANSDLNLSSGDIGGGNQNKIKEILNEFIKENL